MNTHQNKNTLLKNEKISIYLSLLDKLISLYKKIFPVLLIAPADVFLKANIVKIESNQKKFPIETLRKEYDSIPISSIFSKDKSIESKSNKDFISKKKYESERLSHFINKKISSFSDIVLEFGCGKSYLTKEILLYNKEIYYIGVDKDVLNKNLSTSLKNDSKKKKGLQEEKGNHSIDYYNRVSLIKHNISCSSFESLLREVLKKYQSHTEKHKLYPSISLLGLHSCGDLTSESIVIYKSSSEIKSLCIIGCCLHLTTEKIDSSIESTSDFKSYYKSLGYSSKGRFLDETIKIIHKENPFSDENKYKFPLSTVVFKSFTLENKLFFGRTIRKMSMQSQGEDCSERKDFYNKAYIRALFQVFLYENFNEISNLYGFGDIKTGNSSLENDFICYVEASYEKILEIYRKTIGIEVIDRINQIKQGENKELKELNIKYIEYYEYIVDFFKIRFEFGRIVEYIVLIDRVLYLFEGEDVEDVDVYEIFEYDKSKRNLLIYSKKYYE